MRTGTRSSLDQNPMGMVRQQIGIHATYQTSIRILSIGKRKTMSTLQVQYVPVQDLIPYVGNSRTHSDAQISQVASSIKEFGFTNPILIDESNGIIAGHGRLMAAKKLGLSEVPTITLEGLTEAQKKAYVIADNKLALNAGWDEQTLMTELQQLQELDFNLELTGFDLDELAKLLEPEQIEGLTDEDDVPEVPEEPVSKEGDIWICGNHRVMCGDSTSIDCIDKLMDGHKVSLIFTDPPYNVAFNGRSGKHDVIKNDDLSERDFNDFIMQVVDTIKAIKPDAYYVWCNWKFYGILQTCLDYKACIVWAKNVFGMGKGYRHQHEFCLFNGDVDHWIKNESDLWSVKKDTNYVHPTQKPVELSVRAFGNHAKMLNVLDMFGGSGSTMIGAEQTGRKAFLMELDPKYVDVIVKRWQDFTGKEAVLESTGQTFNEVSNG